MEKSSPNNLVDGLVLNVACLYVRHLLFHRFSCSSAGDETFRSVQSLPQWRLRGACGHELPLSTLLFCLRFRQSWHNSTNSAYYLGSATEEALGKSTSTHASGEPSSVCCGAHSRPPDERPRPCIVLHALGMYLNALGSGAGRMVVD